MAAHEQQAASSSTPSTALKPSSNRTIQEQLSLAQQQCQAERWLQVIHHCEAVIEQCHHYLSQPSELSQTSAKTSGSVTTSESSSLPENLGEFHQVKGELFKSEGDISSAIQAYQQAVQHQPEAEHLHVKLAELYEHQGQTEEAIAHYRKAVSLAPVLAQAHGQLADLYAQQQQWQEAIAHYQQALKQSNNQLKTSKEEKLRKDLGQAYLELGKQFRRQGKVEETVRAYLQAIQQDPRLFEAYNRLRYNLMRYEIKDQAAILSKIVSTCEGAIQLFPGLVPAHITLGYALTKQGKRAEAEACFRGISDRTIRQQHPNPKLWEKAERRGPDYIIIGAEKSGTSSLYQYLRCHPAILPPIEKEIDFFDLEYKQGLDWYLAHFPAMPHTSGWMTGETSANYLYSHEAPQRILQHFPHVKLIVLLRDPIERTVSRYNMMVRNGTEKRSFEDAMHQEIEQLTQAMDGDEIHKKALNVNRHLGNSLYYYHLKRWLACFPREQLLILSSEQFFSRSEETMRLIYQNLGLNHSSKQDYPKYNKGKYEPISLTMKEVLSDFFKPSIHQLERLLNFSFDWDVYTTTQRLKDVSLS